MHPKELPFLVVSDVLGHLMPHPTLRLAGRSGNDIVEARIEDCISLPPAASSSVCPNAWPSAWMQRAANLLPCTRGLKARKSGPPRLSGAAHTATLMPAYASPEKNAPKLPSSPTPPWAGWTPILGLRRARR